jgi:hypothetical protein
MKVISEAMLNRFRGPGLCECGCGQWSDNREAHHAFVKRGMGGGTRMDVKENLCGLRPLPCHYKAEHSQEFNRKIQERIAVREGRTVEEIRDWLNTITAAPKRGQIPPRPWETRLAPVRRRRPSAYHRGPAQDGKAPPGGVSGRAAGSASRRRDGGGPAHGGGWRDF